MPPHQVGHRYYRPGRRTIEPDTATIEPGTADVSKQVPPSLLHPGLEPVWKASRSRLDRFGPQRRGSIALPKLAQKSILTLESLLERRPGRRLDLTRLEEALAARRIADDLCSALTRLGHPPSREAAQRRADRAESRAARSALTRAAASWSEPWADAWAVSVVNAGLLSGLDCRAVEALADDMRRLLDHLDRTGPHNNVSRVDLAAALYGSAHALDRGGKRAAFAAHALRHRLSTESGVPAGRDDDTRDDDVRDADVRDDAHGTDARSDGDAAAAMAAPTALGQRELWESVGVLPDRVSAPVLTWRLPVVGASPLDEQIRAASAGALPVHVSLFALRRHPIAVPRRAPVLVVENPRLVEASAERGLPSCVISSNGNPSTAVTALIQQLQEAGASVWYHGDFDAAGIAICNRMHGNRCAPWKMDASDYESAVRLAERDGVRLERDTADCGPTPWDPTLQEVFTRRRLAVHEESVLDSVLGEFCRLQSAA